LYHQLENQGVGVDFVGSQRLSTDNQTPADLDFDQDHEGHSGWRSDQIKANIANWASTYRPDVVLLHIGTNDIRQGVSPNVAANNVAGIIDILRSIVPNVKIVVAQIIPCGDADPNLINAFNQLIPNIASQKNNANSRVVVADQFSGFSLATDSDDNLHPNDSGDQKMADRWYQQLAPLLT